MILLILGKGHETYQIIGDKKYEFSDVKIVNKDAIQKLGAKGIVEIDNQLKIILGPNAKALEKYIDDLKK